MATRKPTPETVRRTESGLEFKNALILKDESGQPLKRADGSVVTGIFQTLRMPNELEEGVLVSFDCGPADDRRNVAKLSSDNKLVLSASFLGQEKLQAILQAIPGAVYDKENGTVSIDTQPPASYVLKDGVFELTTVGADGSPCKCIIDPLGVEVKDKDGNTIAKQRASVEDISPEKVIDPTVSPELVELMLTGRMNFSSTQNGGLTNLPGELIDLYMRDGIRKVEEAIRNGANPGDAVPGTMVRKNNDGSYSLYGQNGVPLAYQVTAVQTAESQAQRQQDPSVEPTYHYLVSRKNSKGKEEFGAWSGEKFVRIDSYDIVQDSEHPGSYYIALHHRSTPKDGKGDNQNRVRNIPIPMVNGQLDGRFIDAVVRHFDATGTSHRANPESGNPTQSSTGQVRVGTTSVPNNTIISPDVRSISIQSRADRRETTVDPPPRRRTNPYKRPPKKAVKKKPFKLNEDAIRYGGFAISIVFVMLALLVFPAAAGILMAAGIATFVGSQLLANKVPEINGSPYNQAATNYVSGLTKAQERAEDVAERFWGLETEYGNTSDELAHLYRQVTSPEFQQTPGGAMIARLLEQRYPGDSEEARAIRAQAHRDFWHEGNIEERERILTGLQDLTSRLEQVPQNATPEQRVQIEARNSARQAQFLVDQGFVRQGASEAELEEARARIFAPIEMTDQTSGRTQTLSAQDLIGQTAHALQTYDGLTYRKFDLHDQVGDILQTCSGRALDRILGQKGVNLEQFVREHSTDFARRFLYRKDITQTQRQAFFDRLSPASIEVIQEAMDQVESCLAQVGRIGTAQAAHDEFYAEAIKYVSGLKGISEDIQEGKFDESTLKSRKQLIALAHEMLWGIKAEDIKRNAKLFNSVDTTCPDLNAFFNSNANEQILEPVGSTIQSARDEYAALLQAERKILNHPKVRELLADGVIELGDGADIFTLTHGEIGKSSFTDLIKELRRDPELREDAELQAAMATVGGRTEGIDAKRQELLKAETSSATVALHQKVFGGLNQAALHASITDQERHETIEEMRRKGFLTGEEDEQTLSLLAELMIAGEDAIQQKGELQSKSPEAIRKAKEELKTLTKQLANGHYAHKKVSDLEKADYQAHAQEDGHPDRVEDTPPKSQTRASLLSTHKALKKYGFENDDISQIIKKASTLATGQGLSSDDVVRTIFLLTRDIPLSDCTGEGLPKETTVLKEFEEIIGPGLASRFMDNPEKLGQLLERIGQKRTARQRASKASLRAYEQIAGRKQVQHVFNRRVRGRDDQRAGVNMPSLAIRIAESRLAKERSKAIRFLDKVEDVADGFSELGRAMGPTTRRTDLQARVNNLKTSLGNLLSRREMSELAKDFSEIERKIATGQFSVEDFKKLREKAKKMIKKRDAKRAKKLAKRKKKAQRHDTRSCGKGVSNETIRRNRGLTEDAIGVVESQRADTEASFNNGAVREFATETSSQVSSPTPSAGNNSGPSAG